MLTMFTENSRLLTKREQDYLTFNNRKKSVMWLVIAARMILGLTVCLALGLIDIGTENQPGAIVSNAIGCADVGKEMLEEGGNVVDAAIATLLCEGVMMPQSMGIGGGFVAILYIRNTRTLETITAREAAPAAANRDMFVGDGNVTGVRATAVPGEILGYWEMHLKYGRLPWKFLFQPAIKLAREGHVVSEHLENVVNQILKDLQYEPTMAEVFLKPDATPYAAGEYMKRPKLADTLERIAENGANEIYGGGTTGKMLVEDIKSMGGIISERDLRNYEVIWGDGEQVQANLTDDYTLYTTPLPSSGILLAFIMNVINEMYTPDAPTYWHRVVEAFKHAYGQRTKLGDWMHDKHFSDSIKTTYSKLMSIQFIEGVRQLIRDKRTYKNIRYYGGRYRFKKDHGTANVNVIDRYGNAIAITSTINKWFGIKLRSVNTGIVLNNQMDDFSTPGFVNSFSLPPSPANFIHPFKRPMSSMSPAIILDKFGDVRMVIGGAGGTKIPTSVATTIIKYLILQETLNEAINSGRVHHQLIPMVVEAEYETDESIIKSLRKAGHFVKVLPRDATFAAVTAIGVREGRVEPLFDHRRVGSSAVINARTRRTMKRKIQTKNSNEK